MTTPLLSVSLSRRTPLTQLLRIERAQVLFLHSTAKDEGYPLAVFDGEEVWYADVKISTGVQRLLNDFHPDVRHIRCSQRDFAWMLASTLSRALRPVMYPPKEQPNDE